MLIDWHALAAPLVAALDGMGSPATIAVALALTTLLVEDVAIAAGVALAAQGAISWPLSFAAVGGGIAAGDLGLYALGLGATRFPLLRRYDLVGRFGSTRDALVRGLPGAVLLARVVPGLRLVTYTACGALRVPLARFCAWVAIAVTAWTAGLYALAHAVGHTLAERFGVPAPIAVAAPIVLIALAIPVARRVRARSRVTSVPEPPPTEPRP
ncbi:MAG: VTT domain-containing protein [Burkholderiales bacterium]|jgi:membrane protein DedA with SNARE-associated domain